MKRAAIERQRTLRTWRRHLAYVHGDAPVRCVCDLQPGRFRKGQRMAGCGRPRCYLCHEDKLLKRPDSRQCRSDISLKEWLQGI